MMVEVPGGLKYKRKVEKAKARVLGFNVFKHEIDCELQGIAAWLIKVKQRIIDNVWNDTTNL